MEMKEMIESFGGQLVEGWNAARSIELGHGVVDYVNIIGMGGSALPGDFLRACSDDIFVNVRRDYGMPKSPQGALNICISYSGNTEETVGTFEELVNKKQPCVAIASGGNLVDLARVHNVPCVEVRKDMVPRMALPLISASLLSICERARLIEMNDHEVNFAKEKLNPKETAELGMGLSNAFYMRVPLFYSSTRNEIIAKVGKIALNENAKTQAFYNVIPEMNHNEMNGFEVINGQFSGVFIYDSEDHPQNIKRMQLTQQVLTERGIPNVDIRLPEGNRLFKLMYGIQSLHWASYYLANRYNVDAVNVPVVEKFKKQL
jgi:glucose/mannose-6-phosphate isomerase